MHDFLVISLTEPHVRPEPPTSLPPEVREAKQKLRELGWSYRSVAPRLGVHWTHLAKVLTGRRESRRLISKIHALPPRKEVQA